MSITTDLIELNGNKSDIQDALVAKGVTSAEKHGFNKFAEDITTITNQYTAADEGKVVIGGALVAQTSTTATANGTINTTTNNEVVVNVPNTYTAGDEGKVVDNGQLVAQTDYGTVTDNGTYNTTINDSVTVALPLTTKSVTSNGIYTASSDSAKGYTSVSVNVPNTYTASDEGKVVNNSTLTSQTSVTKTSNGTYDTTLNNSVTINVPTYSSADNGKVVQNGALSSQTAYGTRTTNGTVDTTYNNSIVVSVPTYSASDAGKVVNTSGNLVAQTSRNITANGTYNTTTNNSVVVNVSSNDAIYPMYVLSADSHLINSYELYYTVPDTNKIYIFGRMNSRTSSGARFEFSKPLSECGITSTSSLTVYYFSIDYRNYYASSAASYVKKSYFTITKDTTNVKIEGPNNSQPDLIIISWYPY